MTGNGVTVIGAASLPSTMPTAASAMYARNVSSLLQYLVKDGALAIDREDDLQAGVLITHDGQVVHPALTAPAPERFRRGEHHRRARRTRRGERACRARRFGRARWR